MNWKIWFVILPLLIAVVYWQEKGPGGGGGLSPQVSAPTADAAIDLRPTEKGPPIPATSPETLQRLSAIIDYVKGELLRGDFGEPGSLNYNIVYHFQQTLAAFRGFLTNPLIGPDFYILFHEDISGRYRFDEARIYLGPSTIEQGEGPFLATLFHEYQHHLFHTIYGTPEYTDIARKFYNELAAHLLENLLAVYLPQNYFQGNYRGGLPQYVYTLLRTHEGEKVLELFYDLMVPTDQDPFYQFLLPATKGSVKKADMLQAIDQDFQPDPVLADALKKIARDYFAASGRPSAQ